MVRKDAEFIAQCFMDEMNEKMWDGKGNKPFYFDEAQYEYPIGHGFLVGIHFYYDADDEEWGHYCRLIDADDEVVDYMTGYGIDSVQNIADTICNLCENY